MREKITIGNAFEGESYAGKTSAIESMVEMDEVRDRGIVVVPEYSVMGPLPEFHRETGADIRKIISRIIDLEKKRTDRLGADLEKQGSGLVVFDRGPISCIAFEHAAEKNGYSGAALWLAETFQSEIEKGNIIVPSGMIYLKADRKIIEQRERAHEALGHSRILDFLRDEKVAQSLNEAFAAFGDFLPDQLFLTLDTGNKNQKEIGAEVLQFIKNQPADVLGHVPDFIAYANSLTNKLNPKQ